MTQGLLGLAAVSGISFSASGCLAEGLASLAATLEMAAGAPLWEACVVASSPDQQAGSLKVCSQAECAGLMMSAH